MPRIPTRRAVFLDRDGVLNVPEFRDGRSYAPRRLDAFRLYDDAAESVRRLKQAGFVVIVVTNQPDVGAGLMERGVLMQMHRMLATATGVDSIEVCTSPSIAPCRRRKPAPGMLVDAALAGRIDLSRSFIVGDRAGDIAAGREAGCKTVFIDHGYEAEAAPIDQDATVARLSEAVDWILSASRASIAPLRPSASQAGDLNHVFDREKNRPVALDQAVRRRSRSAQHPKSARRSVHPGLHHQPDADAEGRDPRL